jgi:hypothetical protein
MGKPDFTEQSPEPAATPSEGYTFPQAPTYIVNQQYDARCSRGFYLAAPYPRDQMANYVAHFNRLITPPNVSPHAFDPIARTWLRYPVPGVSRIKPGFQYLHNVDGDPYKAVSCAFLHTGDSLTEGYENGHMVKSLGNKICDIAFGCPAQGSNPERKPLYELEGLKRNDRSGPVILGREKDGSYNLASTLIKGKGQGQAGPAVTASYSDAVNAIAEVGILLHSVFREVIKKSVLREEFEAIEWNCIDNNVFGFGGLEPNNTGLQMNVSSESGGGTLTNAIGEKQGSWHCDQSDDPSAWTLFFLAFNIPPGKQTSQTAPYIFTHCMGR